MEITQKLTSAQKKTEWCQSWTTKSGSREDSVTQGVQAKTTFSSESEAAQGPESQSQWPLRPRLQPQATSWPCPKGPAPCTCWGLSCPRSHILGSPKGNKWDEPQWDMTSGTTYFEYIIIPCKSRWASKIKSTICLSTLSFSTIIWLAPEKTSSVQPWIRQADLKPSPEGIMCQNQRATLKWEERQQINSRIALHTGNMMLPVVHQDCAEYHSSY